jgi:hypothetical protein
MKILRVDHRYELENFEKKSEKGQIIQFIEKEPFVAGGTELRTVNDGTTNEEVLAVLINRLQGLYNKFPSRETALAITKIEEALMWLEKRTANRKARGVEGKQIK